MPENCWNIYGGPLFSPFESIKLHFKTLMTSFSTVHSTKSEKKKEILAQVRLSILSDAAPPAGICLTQICCHSSVPVISFLMITYIGGR